MKSEHKEMCKIKCALYAPTVLRVGLGLLFILPGVMKLLNPAMVTGMLGQLGFPMATFFTWLLIITEIAGGLMLVTGFKTKYAVPPLVIVMLVAIFKVVVPSLSAANAGGMMGLLFHLLALLGLVSVGMSGSGALSLKA